MSYNVLKRSTLPYDIKSMSYGLDLSGPSTGILDKATPDCSNVMFRYGEVYKRKNLSTFSAALTGVPYAMGEVRFFDGSRPFFCCTHSNIYSLSHTLTWTNEGSIFTGDWEHFFSYDVWPCAVDGTNAGLVITNGCDNICVWRGEGYTPVLNTTVAYKARALVVFANHLLLLNTIESDAVQPNRVRWTDVGSGAIDAAATWTDGTGGFADLIEYPDPIQCGIVLGSTLYIFREHSIIEANHVGGNTVFTFGTSVVGVGTHAPRSLGIVHPEKEPPYVMFLGDDDIYAYRGGTVAYPVSRRISQSLFSGVNEMYAHRSHALVVPSQHLYLLFMPSDATTFDVVWGYNYDEDTWTKFTMEATCSGIFRNVGFLTINELVGTINAQTWTLNTSSTPTERPTLLLGRSDSTIKELDFSTSGTVETSLNGYWCTKDFVLGEIAGSEALYGKVSKLEFEAKGTTVTVSYSLDRGVSWSASETFSLQTSSYLDLNEKPHMFYVNKRARTIRFKFSNVDTSGTFSIKSATLWIVRRSNKE